MVIQQDKVAGFVTGRRAHRYCEFTYGVRGADGKLEWRADWAVTFGEPKADGQSTVRFQMLPHGKLTGTSEPWTVLEVTVFYAAAWKLQLVQDLLERAFDNV